MINTIFKLMVILLFSYLIGSLNFAIIISKINNNDIRNFGSKNAGLTNMYRILGKKKAFLVFILDILKVLFIYHVSYLFLGYNGTIFSIFAMIIGHIYPIFFKFNGGKGVLLFSTWILIFNYQKFIIISIIFFIFLLKTKYVSISVINAGIILFFSIIIKNFLTNYYFIILFLINYILIMHSTNIKRLLNNNENTYCNTKKLEF